MTDLTPTEATHNNHPEGAPREETRRRERTLRVGLALILGVYLALAIRLLALLPLWGAVHDEPLHFGYCKYLAVRGEFPRIGEGIYMDPRLYYWGPSAGEAAHHPPGYYLLGSLVYRLLAGQSLATQNYGIRILSLLLGLTALLLLYGACREVFRKEPHYALAVVAGVAVFPHWLMMSSVIYVEVFGAAAAMGALWMLCRYARNAERWGSLCAAGAFVGLMALTKMTLLAFCLGFAWVGLAQIWASGNSRRKNAGQTAAYLGAMVLVAGWWYLRSVLVYGKLFPTSVLPGQLETAITFHGQPPDMLSVLFVPRGRFYYWLAISGVFRFFWCPSDWLPPATRPLMYSVAAATWLLTGIGLWRGLRRRDEDLCWLWRRFALPLLAGLTLMFFHYLRWTVTTCVQAHAEFGKFVQPLFGFASLLFALSARALFGSRGGLMVVAAFCAFFVLWDALAIHHLATVLIPRYAPTIPVP
ncbi:MAG: hypothetical protein AUJ96_26705 [Armatimonadetes bacterium CG2_30_66_41]|nr:MAG: hypothetical protein AUJ96_26705 [Armatimonadetes bacterium CG2_30_66_41]